MRKNMNNTTCIETYSNYSVDWCPAVFDNWLCWPPTPPGQNATLECPVTKGLLSGGKAYRYCTEESRWEISNKTNNSGGYSHYDECFIPQLKALAKMCNELGKAQCSQIAKITRSLEMVGLSFSLISLIVSLYIFFHYSILKNNRTKIHKNLFMATLLHVIFRLIKYVDQGLKDKYRFIENTPYINEMCIILLEYTKTAMFIWMFIEGLYLHNIITFTVFQECPYIKYYFYIGWTAPILMTAAWAVVMIILKLGWDFYYYVPYYWILEGPRTTVITINFLFLLNIIRVLIVKLRESRTSEIEQVRKAVRAAIFLLPLMGIANIFFWLDFHFTEAWKFALWSYSSYFLNTFQGFFVAVLYCFLNGEVQSAIKNSFTLRMSLRTKDYVACRNTSLQQASVETLAKQQDARWIRKCLKPFGKMPTDKEVTNKRREVWPQLSEAESDMSLVEEKIIETKV